MWQEASQPRFGSFAELNVWLLERCRQWWQERRHPEQSDLSVAAMLEREPPFLMPVPTPFDGSVETLGRVSSTSLVTLARNRYSVPCEWVGRMVSLHLYPERVEVMANETLIARHDRLFDRGRTCDDWPHDIPLIERKPGALRHGAPFAEMPEALRQLQRVLLKREGGDRIMAQVLATVPTAGLEAVLVAVERVVESGAISAEHLLNVVARLQAPPPTPPVVTSLQVQETPVADPARDDRLWIEEVSHA